MESGHELAYRQRVGATGIRAFTLGLISMQCGALVLCPYAQIRASVKQGQQSLLQFPLCRHPDAEIFLFPTFGTAGHGISDQAAFGEADPVPWHQGWTSIFSATLPMHQIQFKE